MTAAHAKRISRPLFLLTAAVCLILIAVIVVDLLRPAAAPVQASDFLMGTAVEVQLDGSRDDAQAVLDALRLAEDKTLSRRRAGSLVSRINAHEPTPVPADFAALLHALLEVSDASGGAFSVLVGRLSDAWDFDSDPHLPDEAELAAALAALRQGGLTLEEDAVTLDDGITLDLGGAGKGAGCDIAADVLRQRGVSSALVSVGGSLLLWGEKERTVGIRDPFGGPNDAVATLRLKDCCVSTSGNYEKYFDRDGVRYHHILDPATGRPADSGLCSVTVVCDSGLLSDALATACFVLGEADSRSLLARYGAEGVFITADGAVTATDGLRQVLALRKAD